jgi:hypothetical protein
MKNKTMLSMDQLNSVSGGADQETMTVYWYVTGDGVVLDGPFKTSSEASSAMMQYVGKGYICVGASSSLTPLAIGDKYNC